MALGKGVCVKGTINISHLWVTWDYEKMVLTAMKVKMGKISVVHGTYYGRKYVWE